MMFWKGSHEMPKEQMTPVWSHHKGSCPSLLILADRPFYFSWWGWGDFPANRLETKITEQN